MSTKKLQIIDYNIKQAENADTLDGKHAVEFAAASDVSDLQSKVGDTSVAEQITSAVTNAGVLTIDITDAEAGTANLINADSLGGVAASEYALKTDTAPDSSKLGGKAPEYYIQPRNLLDNSDFRNPVNQRGFVNGNAVELYNYFIDRWVIGESPINPSLNNNGIMPNGAFFQRLDNLSTYIGRNMTFAIGLSSGDIVIASGTLTDVSANDITIFNTTDGQNEISVGSDGGVWYAWIDYPSSTIQWAALYEGSYTAETLPPYVPKGYAAELAECQRYYYQSYSNGSSSIGTSGMIVCEAITTSKATNVFFPQTMRMEKPTVTLYSPFSGNVDKASEYVSETEVDVKAGSRSRHRFMLDSTASAFEIGKHYCIHYTVSADL